MGGGHPCPSRPVHTLLSSPKKTGPFTAKAIRIRASPAKGREAIKQNLPDLVTEENIIMSGGKQIVKVPIRSLDEYRIIYNFRKQKHVGQGDGESQVGDVLGRDSQLGPAGQRR